MRYTSLGAGHPAVIRRITRNCFAHESSGDTTDDVSNGNEMGIGHAENSDGEVDEGCGDDNDHEASDEEFSDEELEHGNEEDEKDDGWEGDDNQDQDEHDDLSF